MVTNDFAQLIGNTPLFGLTGYCKKNGISSEIFAKLEYFNPAGSIKDRAALYMINDAEENGRLTQGSVIIEPTSGNTGIGLAAVACSRGYRCIIVMPDTMSKERCQMMRAYGAELVLTPGALGMKGSIDKAEELAKTIPSSFIPGQFVNPANALAHEKTTGPEIWNDLKGKIDVIVAGVGTGGTITGLGHYFKKMNPDIRIVAVEPQSSPMITKGVSGPHKIQGIGANFVPELLDMGVVDEVICISDKESYKAASDVSKTEGLFVGISSGAALSAAEKISARSEYKNSHIVVIFPDGGNRYLSVDGFIE